jgi:alkylation response protein AidB-like acyl-CoA dehydrogenase
MAITTSLNGTKQFISGAGYNDVYVCMVRTGADRPKGITCLVIEKDTAGRVVRRAGKEAGLERQPHRAGDLRGCRVPVANRVGAKGEGFRFAMAGLDGGRLNIGACSLGGAQRCLDEAMAYTRDRQQFGQAIADFQNTQFMLGRHGDRSGSRARLLYLAACQGDRKCARQEPLFRHGQAAGDR